MRKEETGEKIEERDVNGENRGREQRERGRERERKIIFY